MTEYECQQCKHRQEERCMRLQAEVSDRASELEGLQQQKAELAERLRLVAADLQALEAAVLEQLLAEPPDICPVPRLAAYITRRNLQMREN